MLAGTLTRLGAVLIALQAPWAHPLGLAVLSASLLLAALAQTRASASPLSAGALFGWGLLAYAFIVLVAARTSVRPWHPELQRLLTVRKAIARGISRRQSSGGSASHPELAALLSQGLIHLDEEIVPALAQLLDRKAGLSEHLALYETGKLPSPDPVVLERLRAASARQQAAVDRGVQQVANAEGTLVELLEQADWSDPAGGLQAWVDELVSIHDAISVALRGEYDRQGPAPLPMAEIGEPRADGGGGLSTQREAAEDSAEQFRHMVEEALRRVNKPSALAGCRVIDRIPLTLQWVRAGWAGAPSSDATPLERAQALREVLVAAIEQLRPADGVEGASSVDPEQHQILAEEYLLGMATRHICNRHGISDSTLYRYRSEGVRVLADELRAREALLSREHARSLISPSGDPPELALPLHHGFQRSYRVARAPRWGTPSPLC